MNTNNENNENAQVSVPDSQNNALETVPALALTNVVVFPFALSPLVISEEASIRTIEKAMEGKDEAERLLAFFPEIPDKGFLPDSPEMQGEQKIATPEGQTPPGPAAPLNNADDMDFNIGFCDLDGKQVSSVGVLVRIVKMLKFPDGTVRILVRGISRIRYLGYSKMSGGIVITGIKRIVTRVENNIETIAMIRNATKQFQEVVSFSPNFPEELKIAILNLTDSERIADLIADTLNFSYPEKLAILTMENFQERLHLLTILLNREVEVLRLGSEIQNQVHSVMGKSQREFFLREQMKQIQSELGEGEKNPDVASIHERLKNINMPEDVRKLVLKETERLDVLPQASGEYNIAYTYIDWLLAVPWNVFTEDRLDIKEAFRILEHDHYGLKDVKERILEFLSVLQLKKDRKSPIICFVGPPGVGKTSLGKSIAAAMGRKFIRMSLGGVRDEAEIRGHRRTYIGALPGRIIQGMKKAGTSNPVFMLDELDKLGNDHRGDPASALLEVLDPQQNNAFNDHFLEVDYDLSNVMFIATANIEDTIPAPLRDRMEIIRLPGYTAFEKHEIARRYLIPRQMQENGLKAEDIRVSRSAVDEVITYYTMEAGVRGLERVFGKICRKIARQIVEGTVEAGSGLLVNPEKVHELLGARRFVEEETVSEPHIGVVTGLAWTSAGGVTLQVEATMMPGKGDLRLTGSLGDVMKESAMAAFSYIRSRAEELGIKPEIFAKNDIHIHVPDGATPKDGPSAGVTMTTALVSLLTGRQVRPRLAMTGEITLRGRVTAIGGVREKVIAALRTGVYDVILPKENEKDLEDVPEEVKKNIRFHFASVIDDVLSLAVPAKLPVIKPVAEGKKMTDEIYTFTPDAQEQTGTAQIPPALRRGPVRKKRKTALSVIKRKKRNSLHAFTMVRRKS